MSAFEQWYNGMVGFHINSEEGISLEAVNITDPLNPVSHGWHFGTDGNLTLPTVSLGTGLSEQATIRSQRKIIPSNYYSTEIQGSTPTVVYTASEANIMTFKGTFTIHHDTLGYEMFDMAASRDLTGNVYYTVTNRVKPPTITDTTAIIDLNGSNVMQVTFTLNSSSLSAFVKYDTTEFGTSI